MLAQARFEPLLVFFSREDPIKVCGVHQRFKPVRILQDGFGKKPAVGEHRDKELQSRCGDAQALITLRVFLSKAEEAPL